jgi:hypothetical protein
MSVFRDILSLLQERKKFWLMPMLLLFLLFGGLLVLTQGSLLAPFIYTIF